MGDQDEERATPKLTLMEEVLLLGLKDKQVRRTPRSLSTFFNDLGPGLPLLLER